MSKIIPGDRLTAYQRWELPSVDQAPPESDPSPPEPSPSVVSAKAEARQRDARSSKASSTPPTLDEIEAIQNEAHEEGFAAGYQEGRHEGREQGYKKGQQEGHSEGYQRGYAEGLAAGRDEMLLRVQKLDQILSYMQQPLEGIDATVEEELAKLATEIARQLVRRELRTSPGEVVAVVREGVSLLPVGSTGIQVRLHPDDARLIREVLSLGRDDEPLWKIIEDQALSRGGCIINTELSRIDATVEKRLGAVIAAVLGDERENHVSRS
ncbi:MAG: flagellar assembly protein FliH [Candidatus Competibacteraceae bacterium]|nr:flagellar assembly protein FliH [Candidatus Competibacteraceae bacterium]